jgi:hypothetical protein
MTEAVAFAAEAFYLQRLSLSKCHVCNLQCVCYVN